MPPGVTHMGDHFLNCFWGWPPTPPRQWLTGQGTVHSSRPVYKRTETIYFIWHIIIYGMHSDCTSIYRIRHCEEAEIHIICEPTGEKTPGTRRGHQPRWTFCSIQAQGGVPFHVQHPRWTFCSIIFQRHSGYVTIPTSGNICGWVEIGWVFSFISINMQPTPSPGYI